MDDFLSGAAQKTQPHILKLPFATFGNHQKAAAAAVGRPNPFSTEPLRVEHAQQAIGTTTSKNPYELLNRPVVKDQAKFDDVTPNGARVVMPLHTKSTRPIIDIFDLPVNVKLINLSRQPILKASLRTIACSDLSHPSDDRFCVHEGKYLAVDIAKHRGMIFHGGATKVTQMQRTSLSDDQMKQITLIIAGQDRPRERMELKRLREDAAMKQAAEKLAKLAVQKNTETKAGGEKRTSVSIKSLTCEGYILTD